MKSQDLSRIWEFEDNLVIGMKFTGEEIIVFGIDNIYTCSIDSPIRPLRSFRGNSLLLAKQPTSPAAIIRRNGSVLWGSGSTIYGYGRPNNSFQKIFYQPYSSGSNIVSMFSDGNTVWSTTDSNALYDNSLGSRGTSSIMLPDVDFKIPYRFAFAKLLLRSAMTTGMGVTLQINCQNGLKLVMSARAFDFATFDAKASYIFQPKPGGSASDVIYFQDLTNIALTNVKATIRRFEIWGIPGDPQKNLMY